MVSVVIPTYNRADCISEVIESVINQTYKNFELIVVDDGSHDNTLRIVNPYLRKYPRKVRYYYQENRGVSAARNAGIEKARAKFIAFLDSDDVAHRDWLANGMKGFIHKDVGVVCGRTVSYSLHTLTGSLISRYHRRTRVEQSQRGYVDFFIGTNMVFRKSVFDTIGTFDERLSHGEDTDLNLRVLHSPFKIYFIPEAVVHYRHRGSVADLLRQRFGYGYGKVLLYQKHISLRKNVFHDIKDFVVRSISFSARMISRVFAFIFIRQKRDVHRILIFPLLIACMASNYLGRLRARLKYNMWF